VVSKQQMTTEIWVGSCPVSQPSCPTVLQCSSDGSSPATNLSPTPKRARTRCRSGTEQLLTWTSKCRWSHGRSVPFLQFVQSSDRGDASANTVTGQWTQHHPQNDASTAHRVRWG